MAQRWEDGSNRLPVHLDRDRPALILYDPLSADRRFGGGRKIIDRRRDPALAAHTKSEFGSTFDHVLGQSSNRAIEHLLDRCLVLLHIEAEHDHAIDVLMCALAEGHM